MHLYQSKPHGIFVTHGEIVRGLPDATWDELINHEDLLGYLRGVISGPDKPASFQQLLAPIGTQEVWAAGVTYVRSRNARMDESKAAGGGSFYDRVYEADRPELFFKANAHAVVGPGSSDRHAPVRIRADAKWSVPEPELVLVVNARGKIVGYTVGNDMSSRDIEGDNPLYLPQAKVYDGSCAMGPAVLVTDAPLPPETWIEMTITRGDQVCFEGATTLARMKRQPEELVEWLYREHAFPTGCYLFTGTGVVPPDDFTLRSGDRIQISIDEIGELTNRVG